MKRYISPSFAEHTIRTTGIICASGSPDRVSSGIGLSGGDRSSDPISAF